MDDVATARRLYDAFAAHDAEGLLAELHPGFEGDVSAGMPLGVGGRHEGPVTMLERVWAPVFLAYDVTPVPDELLAIGDGRVVALGAYRGTVRDTGEAMAAAFAHVLTFTDGKVSALRQITDTASWPTAQECPPA